MTINAADDLYVTAEEREFRARVRSFLASHVTRKVNTLGRGEGLDEASVQRARIFQEELFQAGLAGLTWPTEYGGQGLPGQFQTIYNDEVADYDVPDSVFLIGFGTCIPTLLTYGTEAQKRRYVLPAMRGEEIWCQLLSEPAAGSDLAGLRSAAVRDGDDWVLNGQKVWTTGAHYCQFGLVLARTDPDQPKHRGLSAFILDMQSPGVSVRPLRQMDGTANFNEVFFDDVRIPADRIVGEPGDGWRVLLTNLMNERLAIGTRHSTEKVSPYSLIATHVDLARRRGISDNQIVRQELADLLVRSWVLEMVGLRIRSAVAAGREPGPEGSVAKLARSIVARRSAELACTLTGPAAAAWSSGDVDAAQPCQMMVFAPGLGIAGGTSEIMRNTLAERVLGLPREPQVDRDVPFRQLAHN